MLQQKEAEGIVGKLIRDLLSTVDEEVRILDEKNKEYLRNGFDIDWTNIVPGLYSFQLSSENLVHFCLLGKYVLEIFRDKYQIINPKSRSAIVDCPFEPMFSDSLVFSNSNPSSNNFYIVFASNSTKKLKIIYFQEETAKELICIEYPSVDSEISKVVFATDSSLLCLQSFSTLFLYHFNGESVRCNIESRISHGSVSTANIFENALETEKIKLELLHSIPCGIDSNIVTTQNTSTLESATILNLLFPKFQDTNRLKNAFIRNIILWSKSSTKLSVYTVKEDMPMASVQLPTKICCTALSPSTDTLVLGMENSSVIFVDTKTWLTKKWIPPLERESIESLHFSFDEQFLLVLFVSRKIVIYKNSEDEQVQINYFIQGDVTSPLYIIPLDHVLVVAIVSQLRVYLFDIRSGTLITYLPHVSKEEKQISFFNNWLCEQVDSTKLVITMLGKSILEAYPNLNSFEVNDSVYQFINQTIHYERNKEAVIEKYFSAATTLLGTLSSTTSSQHKNTRPISSSSTTYHKLNNKTHSPTTFANRITEVLRK